MQGNQSYRAPEVLNTVSLYRANPGTSAWEWMDLSKQGSFECGVLLYWMATQRDALPNYPASYGSPGNIRYSVSRIAWSAMPAAYPPGVQAIVQGLMEFDHTRRMSVADAKAALLALPESLDAAVGLASSRLACMLAFSIRIVHACVVFRRPRPVDPQLPACCQSHCRSAPDRPVPSQRLSVSFSPPKLKFMSM